MKLVRENINEKFIEDSNPIRDMNIGKVPFHYNNLYVAKHDIEYVSNGRKIKVPKGIIITAQGGGYMGNFSGNISLGNISKINGKSINVLDYDIRKDKDNYVEIYYDVWEKALMLSEKIEEYFRNSSIIENAAKTLDIDKIYEAVEQERNLIKKIEKLLK